ncbi:hypothetical protein MPER_05059 [Moniliophthora perniciosa FA553]|nr:hypothetical protein MPER_05059 [Moniliophthora perniciosa FA553]
MSPALPDIGRHYKIKSESVAALTLSIFLLAWVVGPLFFGPLSEVYGRRWVFIGSNLFFLAFNIACIFAPSTGSLIAFRFLAGLGSSVPISTGSSLISDLFVEAERAGPTSVSLLGILMGPPLGPVMGGYLTQTVGFKYCFVVSSALCGAAFVVASLYLKETYGPVIREGLARQGSSSTGDVLATTDEAQEHPSKFLFQSFVRPFELLIKSFVCFVFSLYAAM